MSDTEQLTQWLTPLVKRAYTGRTARRVNKGHDIWTQDPLTQELLRAHLEEGPLRGVCPIAPGDDRTAIILYDLDDHGGVLTWADKAGVAQRIINAAEAHGVYLSPVSSSGGNGIHLIGLWQEPQDAYSVRELGREILTAADLDEGAGGLEQFQVELFPKQNRVAEGNAGNQAILPLGGNSRPLEPLLGLEPVERDAVANWGWAYCTPVPTLERPDLPVQASGGDESLAEIESALATLPNEGDGLGYDEWRDVIFGIHYVDPGPDGLAVADAFSARSNKHDSKFLAERVWPYISSERSSVITGRTVTAKAREHGWIPPDEVVAEEFDFKAPTEESQTDEDFEMPRGLEREEKTGAIKATLDNVCRVVGKPKVFGYEIGHDNFAGETMIAYGDQQWRSIREDDPIKMRLRLGELGFRPVGRDMMRDAIIDIAGDNEFDSAILWLTKEVPAWDGVPRIHRFFADYMEVEDDDYASACSRYTWTALAARVLAPGAKADMTPILHGTQGTYKSTGVKAMVPSEKFHTEIDLKKKDDDLSRQLRGILIGELEELQGLSKRDIDHVKSFISKTHETWTPKYHEQTYSYPRRGLFIGTTNEAKFLADASGHRRFLPMTTGDVHYEAIARDRNQLWAEACERYREEGIAHNEAERLAREVHEHYQVIDPWREPVEAWLEETSQMDELIGDGAVVNGDRPFAISEVLTHALDLPKARHDGREAQRVGDILKTFGYRPKRVRLEGRSVSRWVFDP